MSKKFQKWNSPKNPKPGQLWYLESTGYEDERVYDLFLEDSDNDEFTQGASYMGEVLDEVLAHQICDQFNKNL